MTAATGGAHRPPSRATAGARRRPRARHVLLYVFLTFMALLWIFPVFWAVLNSFRDYDYTSQHGYVSAAATRSTTTPTRGEQGDFGQHFLNSVDHHRARGPAHAASRLVRRLRRRAVLAAGSTCRCSASSSPRTCCRRRRCSIPVYRMYRAIEVPFWFSDSGTLLNSYWA